MTFYQTYMSCRKTVFVIRLRKVDQSMINSANKVLSNDNPPGELLTKLPTKFRSEVQAKAVQAGRTLFVRVEVDELFKKKRRDNIRVIK